MNFNIKYLLSLMSILIILLPQSLKAFTMGPADIDGCVLWLDGSDPANTGTVTTGKLTNWINKVNTNNANQADISKQATVISNGLNNRSVVQFSNSDQFYDFNTINDVRTVFLVIQETNQTQVHSFLGFNGAENTFARGGSESNTPNGIIWGANASNAVKLGQTYLDSNPIEGTSTKFPENSFHILTFITTTGVPANRIFKDGLTLDNSWEGNVAEIIIYNRQLTNVEMQFLWRTLNGKWGLSNDNSTVIANNDTFPVAFNTPCKVHALGVLANDENYDLFTNSLEIATPPLNGTLTLSDDGSFVYTPNNAFSGTDSFVYSITNNGIVQSQGTVTLNVSPDGASIPPVAMNDTYTMAKDQVLNVTSPGIMRNDYDANADTLKVLIKTQPQHGTLTLDETGSFQYTPETNFCGTDSFEYILTDSVNPTTGTVILKVETVNLNPFAGDDFYTIISGSVNKIKAPGLLNNDFDPENKAIVINNNTQPQHGTLNLNNDGSFEYEPEAAYTGPDQFTYTITDGQNEREATVNLEISNVVNSKPVLNNDNYLATQINILNLYKLDDSVLANDFISDGVLPLESATVVNQPIYGSIHLFDNGTFLYNSTNTEELDFFTYTLPGATTNGIATIYRKENFQYPMAVNDFFYLKENSSLEVQAPGVLANDINNNQNQNGEIFSVYVDKKPQHGTLSLIRNGKFQYTPETDFTGYDSFSYIIDNTGIKSQPATVWFKVFSENYEAPIAVNDLFQVTSNIKVNVPAPGVMKNDTNINNTSAFVKIIQYPQYGELNLNNDGSFSYISIKDYDGEDFFTYKLYDGRGATSEATVTLQVIKNTEATNAPMANNDLYTIPEHTLLKVDGMGVLANDKDFDYHNTECFLSKVTDPAHGQLSMNLDGSFTYLPDTGYLGEDSFTYTLIDNTGLESQPATVRIFITEKNSSPFAINDAYPVLQNTPLTISAPGILKNDFDIDGDNLTVLLYQTPSNGTLSLNSDGSFTYTPNSGFIGQDFFKYIAKDSFDNKSQIGIVVLNVSTIANKAPTGEDDFYKVKTNTTLIIDAPGIIANDFDDNNNLSAILATPPSHGTIKFNLNGAFEYTPETDYTGDDFFEYKLSDGILESNNIKVDMSITNEEVLLAENDRYSFVLDIISLMPDTIIIPSPGVLNNDVFSGDATVSLVSDVSNGSLTLNSDGSFTYLANDAYTGIDTFTYKIINNGQESNIATVSILYSDNDISGPVALNDHYTTSVNSSMIINPKGVLSNDTSADDASIYQYPKHGTITLNSNDSFLYTPDVDFSGTDSFKYCAYSSPNREYSNVATVTIDISAEGNHKPIGTNKTYYTDMNTQLVKYAPGLLENDSDPDGDNVFVQEVIQPPKGFVSFNPDGFLSYQPNTGFIGMDTFSYKITDNQLASDYITVNVYVGTTEPPVAVNDTYTTPLNTQLDIDSSTGILDNDSNYSTNPLKVSSFTSTQHGTLTINFDGSFSYTPDTDFAGIDSFTYSCISDTISSNTATVSIKVADGGNLPPNANDDSYTVNKNTTSSINAPGILENDTDTEHDTLTAILKTDVTHGSLTLNSDGSFSYTPDNDYTGADSFTYVANDGTSDSSVATVSLNIQNVNHPPQAVSDNYTTNVNTKLTESAPGVLANDSDQEHDSLTAILVTDTTNGSLTFNTDGSFTYTPDTDFEGTDAFAYKTNDGTEDSNTVIAYIKIQNSSTNNPPQVLDDSYSLLKDSVLNQVAPGVLENDTDAEHDSLTAVLKTDVSHGTLTLNADGSFTYTPATSYIGDDSFTYVANDGMDDSSIATVHLTINDQNTNTPPTVNGDTYSITKDTTLSISTPGILNNDTDPEHDSLTAVLKTDVSNGTLTLNSDGSFVYTPTSGYTGNDSFTYVANDGSVDSLTTAKVTINVTNATNNPPYALNDEYSINLGQTLTITAPGVLENDSDADTDSLSAILKTDVSHGTLTLNADGSFTYTPATSYSGEDSFTYVANDGTEDSTEATVTLTITDTRTKVTIGTPINIKIQDIPSLTAGSTFDKIPKIYGSFNDKKLALKKDKTSTETEAKGFWVKKVTLYDKKAIKSGYTQAIVNQPEFVEIPLKVKGKVNGEKVDEVSVTVLLVPPEINTITQNNDTISIQGRYFGTKPPKVYLEPTLEGKAIKCKLVKESYNFNPETGMTSMIVSIKLDKIEAGTYRLIVNNKIGIGVNSTNKIPEISISK